MPDNAAYISDVGAPPPPGVAGPDIGYLDFTEVKFLNSPPGSTNVLQPSTNAGRQLQYLVNNPATSQVNNNVYRLVLGPNTRISPSMLRQLEEAVGVDVIVYQARNVPTSSAPAVSLDVVPVDDWSGLL